MRVYERVKLWRCECGLCALAAHRPSLSDLSLHCPTLICHQAIIWLEMNDPVVSPSHLANASLAKAAASQQLFQANKRLY